MRMYLARHVFDECCVCTRGLLVEIYFSFVYSFLWFLQKNIPKMVIMLPIKLRFLVRTIYKSHNKFGKVSLAVDPV